MKTATGAWLAAWVLGAAGCSMTADQQFAVNTCQKFGNRAWQCDWVNRSLQQGKTALAEGLQQEESSHQKAEAKEEQAKQIQAAVQASGGDPCEDLAKKIKEIYPDACDKAVTNTIEFLMQDNVGCAEALADPGRVDEVIPDFLSECEG